MIGNLPIKLTKYLLKLALGMAFRIPPLFGACTSRMNSTLGPTEKKKKYLEINILRDNRARVRIRGKIYDVTVTGLDDATLRHVVDMAYQRKYDMAQTFGNEIPTWSFYRVEQDGNEEPST